MKEDISQVSSLLKNQSFNSKDSQLHKLVTESLKQFDVHFSENDDEVQFLTFGMSKYQEPDKNVSLFGEKEALSYHFMFKTYNVVFFVKLLSFQYDNKSEILKLEIEPKTTDIIKELEYCCNSLQRRRNLNLMLTTLITFARLIESRRLIWDLILKKNQSIKITQNNDGGIIVSYTNGQKNVNFCVCWTVQCNSNLEVADVVEVFHKIDDLHFKETLLSQLDKLTHYNLNFNKKYQIWKALMANLPEDSSSDESFLTKFLSSTTYKKSRQEQGDFSLSVKEEIDDTNTSECVSEASENSQKNKSSKAVSPILLDSEDEYEVQYIGTKTPSQNKQPSLQLKQPSTYNNCTGMVEISDADSSTYSDPRFIQNYYNNYNYYTPKRIASMDSTIGIPNKKMKSSSTDDCVEITSVTYIVPD